jgi:hypothetical protein
MVLHRLPSYQMSVSTIWHVMCGGLVTPYLVTYFKKMVRFFRPACICSACSLPEQIA